MKLKDLFIIVPVALALVACAKKSDDQAAAVTSTDQSPAIVGGTTTAPSGAPTGGGTGPSGTSGSSGTSGGTSVGGCPAFPSRTFYEYYKSGTGDTAAYTTSNDITADSKLRVSIEPGTAGQTQGTGGTANFQNMSVVVHLLKNGVEVTSKRVPSATGSSGYALGVAVGQKSDPSLLDFSPYLSGNAKYSIKIDTIRTDYKCNSLCTVDAPDAYCYYYYSPYGYQSTCSYVWNWDYHQNQWACCGTGYLQQCQRQQCGVGTVLTNSTWSAYIRVETDITSCIQ